MPRSLVCAANTSSGTPKYSAICDSVSPDLTVHDRVCGPLILRSSNGIGVSIAIIFCRRRRIETVPVCSVVIRRRWRRIKIVIVRRRYWRVVAVAVCAVIIRERIWSVIIVVIVPNLWTAWKQYGIVLGGTAALGGDQISSIEYDGED